jgi:UDP-GlcNAc:undecaprenyl-phosphate/decaprenyl-phosphate GlcNAc-1-phosphate transferase
MPALPLVLSLAVGLAVVPAVVAALRARGLVRANYRGVAVAFPAGIAIPLAAALALALHWYLDPLGSRAYVREAGPALLYVAGVSLLGLADDLLGRARPDAPEPRGWRGHARAALGGRLSTGLVKAAGALVLALLVLSGRDLGAAGYALAVLLLVLVTNLFNLLDLRPGRSIKALVLLGAGLTAGSLDLAPLLTLGLVLGPIVVLGPFDLRERAMLGDTGSNAVGAVAGLWLVLTLPAPGQALALVLAAAATLYGEFRSISALIERTPGLRELDSLGRPTHA